MEKIIIKKWENNFTKQALGFSRTLSQLAEFFLDGGKMDWNLNWDNWVNSSNNVCISGNEVSVCINDENNIEISSYILEGLPYFIVSKSKFLKIIEAWNQVLQLMPEVIELIQTDEGHIIFEYDTPKGHQKIIIE